MQREPAERDEGGRFKGKAPAEPSAKAVEAPKVEAPKQEPTKAAPAGPEYPRHWDAAKRAVWDGMTPEARAAIVDREAQFDKILTERGRELKALEPVKTVLDSHREAFNSRGLSFEAGLTELLNAQAVLDRNPAEGLKAIAAAYKVDLRQLVGEADLLAMGADPVVDGLKAQVGQLEQQIRSLTGKLSQGEEQAKTIERRENETLIEKFAADKPDFESLMPEIMVEWSKLAEQKPGATKQERLSEAYERARWANPESRKRMQSELVAAEVKANEERQRVAAEQARAARSINVRSSAKTDESDDLDAALGRVYDKNRA